MLVASRSAIPWLALAKARLASVRHLLKRAQYDAEVMRERAEIAETATNEARAEAGGGGGEGGRGRREELDA